MKFCMILILAQFVLLMFTVQGSMRTTTDIISDLSGSGSDETGITPTMDTEIATATPTTTAITTMAPSPGPLDEANTTTLSSMGATPYTSPIASLGTTTFYSSNLITTSSVLQVSTITTSDALRSTTRSMLNMDPTATMSNPTHPPTTNNLTTPTSNPIRPPTTNNPTAPTSNPARPPTTNNSTAPISNPTRPPTTNNPTAPTTNPTRPPTTNSTTNPTVSSPTNSESAIGITSAGFGIGWITGFVIGVLLTFVVETSFFLCLRSKRRHTHPSPSGQGGEYIEMSSDMMKQYSEAPRDDNGGNAPEVKRPLIDP